MAVDPSNCYIGPDYTLTILQKPEHIDYIAYAPTIIIEETIEKEEEIYSYTYNDNVTKYDLDLAEDDIKEILEVSGNTIDLPKDFQQIIKVVVISKMDMLFNLKKEDLEIVK